MGFSPLARADSAAVVGAAVLAALCAGGRHAEAAGLVDDPIAAASLLRLDGSWVAELMQATGPVITLPAATVPGDLITDLQSAGLVRDPLYELNFKNASLWDTPAGSGREWVYRTTFATADAFGSAGSAGSDVTLVFDGVKMGATVSLNGVVLGTVTDQFLRYNFTITDLLLRDGASGGHGSGNNTLAVAFDGTLTGGRYMACTGGWDWGP
jgi:beta-mannosidase